MVLLLPRTGKACGEGVTKLAPGADRAPLRPVAGWLDQQERGRLAGIGRQVPVSTVGPEGSLRTALVWLDDALVARIDGVAGEQGRSRLVREAVQIYLDDLERWERLRSLRGSVLDQGHDWDADPAGWVRRQRTTDPRRVG